jgi:hypothetical protein
MPPQDLLQTLRKRPFEPFRIIVSDGTTYDVAHPELVMVGIGSGIVGLPAPNQAGPFYERHETVNLRHVVRLVPATAASGNGQ